jgi:hypothetical protein
MLRVDFAVKYSTGGISRDIHKIHTKRSGVTTSFEYVWRCAAQWAHYTQEQFEELDGHRQATVIALYQTSMQTEAVLAEAISSKVDSPGAT